MPAPATQHPPKRIYFFRKKKEKKERKSIDCWATARQRGATQIGLADANLEE
jgi:hypothetical protein